MVRVRLGIIVVFIVLAIIVISPIVISKSSSNSDSSSSINFVPPDNSDSNPDRHGPKIDNSVYEKFKIQDTVDVIILFDENDVGTIKKYSKDINSNIRIRSSKNSKNKVDYSKINAAADSIPGFEKGSVLETINGYSGKLTRQGYEELLQSNSNIEIYEDRILTIHSALSVGVATVRANYSRNVLGLTGLGVKVGIIDTGIEYTHPDLGGCYGNNSNTSCKVFGGYDFVNNDNDPMDDHEVDGQAVGHGTHVAGILAAYGSSTGVSLMGVAPNATLYALKACSSSGSCSTSNIINAIDWSINNSLDILSISLGTQVSSSDEGNTGRDLLALAVDNAVESGIIVVLSSGNNGPGISTINSPGSAKFAITVGAVNDGNTPTYMDDYLWSSSSPGPGGFGRLDPELVAPGYGIESTFRGATRGDLTGTSMAVPFVSGSAALILQKYPSLSPLDVRRIIMQSTNNISGKVFQVGTGVLDVSNAILYNVSAVVSGKNSYQEFTSNDRWEFVVIPYTTEYANITIINHNSYNITFTVRVENITNMENNFTLNTSQLSIPTSILVPNNSNYTFSINFTLNNFTSVYATTYGGVISLNGSENNGSEIVSKSIRIPIVITIPILNKGYFNRTMSNGYGDSSPWNNDVYYYSYYNTNPINTSVIVSWTNSSYDFDLFVYNSTPTLLSKSNGFGNPYESITTTSTNMFKWVRVHAYDFYSSTNLNFNFTNPSNNVPSIINITAINGSINSTNNLIFYSPANITINITYRDLDNDTTNISINDSGYSFVSTTYNGVNRTTIYTKSYNSSISNNTNVLINVSDIYDSYITSTVNILYLSPINLVTYTSNTSTIYLSLNSLYNLSVSASEANSNTLYYFWIVNNGLNSTNQNYTFNSTIFNSSQNNVSLIITNNLLSNSTNQTIRWIISVDSSSPTLNVSSPTSVSYNDSKITLNYTAIDSSGIDKCWYYSNGSLNTTNITLSNCINATLYFINGGYTINVFTNDSVANTVNSSVYFNINDSTLPEILGTSPAGTIASTSSVVLSLNTSENATCKYDTTDTNYSLMSSVLSNYTTIHNSSYSVSAGDYLLYVRCLDMNNNSNNVSSYFNFTINASTGGGGGGSGGGDSGGGSSGGRSGGGSSGGSGGSGFTGSYSSSSIINSMYGSGVNGGSGNVTFSGNATFNNKNIPVENIEIYSESNYTNISLRIDKPSSLKGIVPPTENDSINSYLNISSKNISENDSVIFKIYFNVEKLWIIERNISENDVILLKYNPETQNWENLTTDMLYEDNESIFYMATSDGVGIYAISYKNKTGGDGIVIPIPEIIENKTINKTAEIPKVHSDSDTQSGSSSSSGISNSLPISELVEKQIKWIAFVVVISFILLTAVGLIIRRVNSNSKNNNIKQYSGDVINSASKEIKHLGVRQSVYPGNLPDFNSNNSLNQSKNNSNILFSQNNFKKK